MKIKESLTRILLCGAALISYAKVQVHGGGVLALPEVDGVPRPNHVRDLGEFFDVHGADRLLDAAFNQGCKDSATFQLARESKGDATCARITANKGRRIKLCRLGEVKQHCPVTCGICGKSSGELCEAIKRQKRCWRLSCCSWRRKTKKCYSRKPNKKCFASDIQASSKPSGIPTNFPSTYPTMDLSANPSVAPSSAPTDSPSVEPSDLPSFSPSVKPSGQPTSIPSTIPTMDSSANPSIAPSSAPTDSPSVEYSDSPSFSPSVKPSSQPTSIPSTIPTMDPSASPSIAPSSVPTKLTSRPTSSVNPTMSPSGTPLVCETTWVRNTLCDNSSGVHQYVVIKFDTPEEYTKDNCRAACEQQETSVRGCCSVNPITSDGGDSTPWCKWTPNLNTRRGGLNVHYSLFCDPL